MAGAHRVSGLRGLRGSRLGDDISAIDAGLISQAIQSGTQIATVALTPQPVVPTVTYNPATGYYQSVGVTGSSSGVGLGSMFGSSSGLSTYLPILLIGGLALAALAMFKK